MLGKLLKWLITRMFGLRYEYFELRDGRYLKVKRGTATIIDVESVPHKHRQSGRVNLSMIPPDGVGLQPRLGGRWIDMAETV